MTKLLDENWIEKMRRASACHPPETRTSGVGRVNLKIKIGSQGG